MTNREAIDQFETACNSIMDNNYGDYSRKVQSYLNRLKQQLNSPSRELAMEVLRLEEYISFNYNQDLETAIMNLRAGIEKIRSLN